MKAHLFIPMLMVFLLPHRASGEVLFTLQSPNEEPNGQFGYSVAGVGDVDNDGFDDVVVGTWGEDPGISPQNAGRAYVFSGSNGELLYELASPLEQEDGIFGTAVAGAGDVDNDGHADILIGAAYEESPDLPTCAGKAYVFSGDTGELHLEMQSPNPEPQGYFGWAVAGVGDIDQDGFDDLVAGAYCEDPGPSEADAGRVHVLSGQNGALLHTLISPNDQFSGLFGASVSGIGDIDNDGVHDVIVGAYGEDDTPWPYLFGKAYVFSGATGEVIHTVVSPNGQQGGIFGSAVSRAGDVNNDGFEDFVVGAELESSGASPEEAGRAYVFSGETGELLFELTSPSEELEGHLGYAVSEAGDVNGDGFADVIVGAYGDDPGNSPPNSGRAYIFSGETGHLLSTLSSPSPESNGRFGWGVAYVGRVNGGNGYGLLISAEGESQGVSPEFAGRAYVFSSIPVGVDESDPAMPKHLVVEGPFPNPTSDWAQLRFRNLSVGTKDASVALYDSNGRRISILLAGLVDGGRVTSVQWRRDEHITPGLYWWTIRLGSFTENRPMVLLH